MNNLILIYGRSGGDGGHCQCFNDNNGYPEPGVNVLGICAKSAVLFALN